MKRLITDKPDNNVEAIANLVHCKDGWLYIRHAGRDVLATDFLLSMCKNVDVICQADKRQKKKKLNACLRAAKLLRSTRHCADLAWCESD